MVRIFSSTVDFKGVLTLAYYPNAGCLCDWRQEKTADDLLGHQRTSQLQLNLILSACSCMDCRGLQGIVCQAAACDIAK